MLTIHTKAGEFFAYLFTVFLCAMILAACYRTLGAGSPGLEVALRFCGVYILISVIFGGYLRSVERLVTDVPWVGWLAVRPFIPLDYIPCFR